jgi:hypothetical protein
MRESWTYHQAVAFLAYGSAEVAARYVEVITRGPASAGAGRVLSFASRVAGDRSDTGHQDHTRARVRTIWIGDGGALMA